MSGVENINEHRSHERHEISIDVIIVMKGRTPMTLKTGNISEGGVFILSAGRDMPKVGETLSITLPEFMGEAQPVAMRAVVRHKNSEGIGIEFQGRLE